MDLLHTPSLPTPTNKEHFMSVVINIYNSPEPTDEYDEDLDDLLEDDDEYEDE